jgi:hypothetical protein
VIRLMLMAAAAVAALWYSDDLARAWRSEPVERQRLAIARWLRQERPTPPPRPAPRPEPPAVPVEYDSGASAAPPGPTRSLEDVRPVEPTLPVEAPSLPAAGAEIGGEIEAVTHGLGLGAQTDPARGASRGALELPEPLAPAEARLIRFRLGRVMELARKGSR